jgi:hypothetical protein
MAGYGQPAKNLVKGGVFVRFPLGICWVFVGYLEGLRWVKVLLMFGDISVAGREK